MRKFLIFLLPICFLVPGGYAHGTTFYADFATSCKGCAGTATTSAFNSLNLFANAARSAGDILIVRRGSASTTNITAMTFTSSGNLNAPISIVADYDDLWGNASTTGGGFATTSETYTPTFGSTYMAGSASSTLAYPNQWIYLAGDCYERGGQSSTYGKWTAGSTTPSCEYAYEIASSSPDGISLYLPYKGKQSGAGVAMRVMGGAPIVGLIANTTQLVTSTSKDYWFMKGIELRSASTGGIQTLNNSRGWSLFDMIFRANGAAGTAAQNGGGTEILVRKTRAFNVSSYQLTGNLTTNASDLLIDCNSVASSWGIAMGIGPIGVINDATIKNCTNSFNNAVTTNSGGLIMRNIVAPASYLNINGGSAFHALNQNYFEDKFGTVGLNSQMWNYVSSDTVATTTMSTTTNLRSGGGPYDEIVFPPSGTGNTGISTYYFPFSYMKLFEYPIYTNTASHTYTMYFMATSSTAFTVVPLTATAIGSSTPELYIECEYYGDATDANRMLKRSNTASAFTADGTWYGIAVTCAPSQSGILYLRGWYAKPRDPTSNIFYMDTQPIIQ